MLSEVLFYFERCAYILFVIAGVLGLGYYIDRKERQEREELDD